MARTRLTRLFRPFMVAVYIYVALLSQIQVAYACGLKDGKIGVTCCCDMPDGAGCEQGGGCQDPRSTQDTDCCDLSAQPTSATYVAKDHARPLPVVQFDGPPSPPVPATLEQPGQIGGQNLRPYVSSTVPPNDQGIRTYLLTNRFRV